MRSLRIFLALVVLLALAATVSPAWSAPAPAPPPQQDEQDSMAGHDGVSKVEQRRLQHLFWAYNAIWLLLGIYVVSLGVRLRSLRRELARMENRFPAGTSGS